MTVVYWSRAGALGESEEGEEYLKRNSRRPRLTLSMQNWASLTSFPGAKNTTVPS
jgi:hypothetical protein